MTPNRREILERVANGDLSPEEADALLRTASDDTPPKAEPTSPVKRVKVAAGFGAVLIEGDPSVAEAEIEGTHTARVEGDTLVIRGEQWTDIDPENVPGAFSIQLGRGRRIRTTNKTIRIGNGGELREFIEKSNLRVRMNPDLELETRLDAGSLSVTGIKGPIRARSAAGPITIEGSTAPLDIAVNAGAIRINGSISDGESRVRSDAGAVRIELDPSSSVHVTAEAALGKVVLPRGERTQGRRFGASCECTVGEGAGTLRVETAMGSIHVSTS